jgi:hypothetical protein
MRHRDSSSRARGIGLHACPPAPGIATGTGEENAAMDHEFDKSKTDVESMTRRGEDVTKREDESGRHDTGTKGSTNRPTGTSTARDTTSVDPKEVTSHSGENRSPKG